MSAQETGAQPERHAIGISFGNSYSSIAYTTSEDKAEVIANEDGGMFNETRRPVGHAVANRFIDRQIPTVLSYVDGEEYYGVQAKSQLVRNRKNTIAYFKEFIGKEFKSIDPTYAHNSAHPIEVEGGVAFTVQDNAEGEPSTVSAQEATTRLLKRLAQAATDYTGKTVDSAVISVPTNFSESQKKALIAAAKEASIEILQLINEPIAALLAYDGRPEAEVKDKTVVVADFGATRSDVSIVACRGGVYTILATQHDYDFAGVHLDQVLMDHFAKEFIKWNTTDPRKEERAAAKLRLECEATKKALSIGTNASFSVESLAEGIDFASTINRLRYETIGRKVFEGFNRLVESTIAKAGLDVLDIDQVVLSGGTSHTPRIANNFRAIFPESTEILAPSATPTAINPSELSARGAALQASLIAEFAAEDIEQSTHAAVTTLKHLTNAIGVQAITDDAARGVFATIIPAETAVPARRTLHIPAPKVGGDVLIKIVEGGSHIKVTKPEAKPKSNGAKVEDANSDDSEEEDSEDEEPEDVREKVWKVGGVLAEAAVKGVKPAGSVEVTVQVNADLSVVVTAREVGSKGGVRGSISA
jgi:molecular chaperone DnaK (HSP70)